MNAVDMNGTSELERSFRETCAKYVPQMEAEIQIMKSAMERLEALSNESGLQFLSYVSPVCQVYTPTSFYSRWLPLSDDDNIDDFDAFMEEHTGVYGYGEREGWEHPDSQSNEEESDEE